jgi:hypothetical protein
MNIYLLSHNQVIRHGRYMRAVVVAKDEEDARSIHPCTDEEFLSTYPFHYQWVPQSEVTVKYLGIASTELNRGVISTTVAY